MLDVLMLTMMMLMLTMMILNDFDDDDDDDTFTIFVNTIKLIMHQVSVCEAEKSWDP